MEGLTRAFLKALGCNDDQISAIAERHTEVTDAIKGDVKQWKDKYEAAKADADKVPDLQKQVDELKGGEDWKAKYEQEHQAFEDHKAQISRQEEAKKVETAYRKLLADEHIKADRHDFIVAHTDLSKATLDKDGNLADAESFKKEINDSVNGWGAFKVTEHKETPKVKTPPEGGTGSGASRARELYNKHLEQQGIKVDAGKE